uniref:Uncharacterized protein n=1 Tax=Panagrolaimus davidi TaxID=227884 RepID=A0A914R0S1_9BILA
MPRQVFIKRVYYMVKLIHHFRKAGKKEKCKYCPGSYVDLAGHIQRQHAEKIQDEATDDGNNKSRRPRKPTNNQMENIIDTPATSTDASEHSEYGDEVQEMLTTRFKGMIEMVLQLKSDLEETKAENVQLKEAQNNLQRINLEQSQTIQTQATRNTEHVQDCVATNTQYKKNDDAEKKKIQELTAENRELIATLDDLKQRNYQIQSNFAIQRSELEAEISRLNVSFKSTVKNFAELKQSTDDSINRLTMSNDELRSIVKTKDIKIKQMEEEIHRLSFGTDADAVEEESFTYSGVCVKMHDVVVDSKIDYVLLSQKILKVNTCEDISNKNLNVWVADGKYITLKKSYQIFLEKELLCRENRVSTLLEYVFGCNFKKLVLINQEICFKEYQKLLASKRIEEVEFRRVQVMGEYDELLRIDEILKDIPNIHKFVYEFRDDEFKDQNAACETSKNLGKLQPFPNLRVFHLFNLQKGFELGKFIKKNPDVDFYPPKCVVETPKIE